MATITRFEDIEAWQIARELANLVYEWSDRGTFSRDYGFKDQIRRAIVSVMSNIAEGYESQTHPLFISYLSRAKGSCGEVRCQLYIALDRGYIDPAQFQEGYELSDRCGRKIYRLMEYLRSSEKPRRAKDKAVEYEAGPDQRST